MTKQTLRATGDSTVIDAHSGLSQDRSQGELIVIQRHCPSCFCVTFTPKARCRAIQDLVRPWETEHLIRRSPSWTLPAHHDFVVEMADWWCRSLDSRQLRYIDDPVDCDRWCSPARTLRRRGGDCDDLAILATSLLLQGGVAAWVVVGRLCDRRGCGGHAWVEGVGEGGPFHFEATNGELRRNRPGRYHAQLELGQGWCMAA